MILVTGSIDARDGCFEELLALSLDHVRRSRGETGCLEHGVYRDVEAPQRLVFVERWADHQALAAHFALPTSREFARAATALAASAPEITLFDAAPTTL
jgi:quinol monooxygenase YgiN